MKPCIGGYDENAFKGRLSVNIFERILLDSRRAIPNIPVGDTNPNFDGDISVCKTVRGMYIPTLRLAVQVKTLPINYYNTPTNSNLHKYKYVCDTKVMFSVLGEYTRDLAYLIMVDIPNESVFALPITKEYCVSLGLRPNQYKKTIYFDDTEKITNVDKWILSAQEIDDKMQRIRHDEENIKFLLPYTANIPNHVTDAVNYINNVMDNEFCFVKQCLFPHVWKFGISYMPKGGLNEEHIGIFEIKKDGDEYVRRFDSNSNLNMYEIMSKNVNIIDCINHVIDSWVDSFFNNAAYMYTFMPTVVLIELLYKNIDDFYADNMSTTECGETVCLHYPAENVNYDDAMKLALKSDSKIVMSLLAELRKRGLMDYLRPWKTSYEYRVIKSNLGKNFIPLGDEALINAENNRRFIKNAGVLCKEILDAWGIKSKHMFRLQNYAISVTADFRLARCIVTESDCFAASFLIEDDIEFKTSSWQFMSEERNGILSRSEFKYDVEKSWYSFWYRFSLLSFRDFLHRNDADKSSDPFIDSLIGNLIVP